MKHLKSSAASALAFFAAIATVPVVLLSGGCGGSGQGATTTPNPLAGLSTPRIEAIVLVSGSNLLNPSQFTSAQLLDPTSQAVKANLINPNVFGFQDMTDFQTGEDYVFQLVAYGPPSAGNPFGRVVLPASFSTSDLTGAYGTLADNSGVFLASNSATTAAVTIYASYNGQSFTGLYDVKPRQARLIGKVALQTTNAPVSGAILDFYDVNGNLTGTVTSAVDGTFRASIPASSATMTVDPHSLGIKLYGVFVLGSLTYNAGDPGCRALLPALSEGFQTLPTIFAIPTTVPTAPVATGCG